MFNHKGYMGSIEVDAEEGVLYGRVMGIRDVISYVSDSVGGLQNEFVTSVDMYLEACAEKGIEPNRPFNGTLSVRLGGDLHRRATLAAAASGISVNEFVKIHVDKGAAEYA